MSALRTNPARRPATWGDHVIAVLGCLAAAASAGALLVLAAQGIESFLGARIDGPGLLAVLWVFGIGLMHAPLDAWPLALLGGALLAGLRQAGLGGWGSALAVGIALALAVSGGLLSSPPDLVIRLVIGAAMGFFYWKIIDIRTRPTPDRPFTDD